MIQGTEEWFAARLGKITGSRVSDILPGAKGSYLASRKNYMAELVCEILTGQTQEGFTSAAMQWGTDTEPLARAAYEAITGNTVQEVGFILHPAIANFGASPDGNIPELKKCIEIKCPNTATHLDTLLNGTIDYKYKIQMMCEMMVTGSTECDFISFDPRLPDKHSIYIYTFPWDEMLGNQIPEEIEKFNSELFAMIDKLQAMR